MEWLKHLLEKREAPTELIDWLGDIEEDTGESVDWMADLENKWEEELQEEPSGDWWLGGLDVDDLKSELVDMAASDEELDWLGELEQE